MAKKCALCGKTPVVGRQHSHANNVSPRRFEPNLQTVRALSRVTEVGGYVETGHSRRVSQLAVAMGRELAGSGQESTFFGRSDAAGSKSYAARWPRFIFGFSISIHGRQQRPGGR